jgi:hypothetical protein
MSLHNLLSLPHLPAIHTKCKKPLIDYSQTYVITYIQYLNILRIFLKNKVMGEGKEKKKKELK